MPRPTDLYGWRDKAALAGARRGDVDAASDELHDRLRLDGPLRDEFDQALTLLGLDAGALLKLDRAKRFDRVQTAIFPTMRSRRPDVPRRNHSRPLGRDADGATFAIRG